MLLAIFTTEKNVSDKLISKYLLKKVSHLDFDGKFEIYKNKWVIVICSLCDEVILRKSILYTYSEYKPDFYIFIWEWTKISNEILPWDIILPNVFFELDKNIINTDIDINNRDNFISKPIFLENYNIQSDYDFSKFWLRVGWVGLSWDENKDIILDNLEKIIISYEPDYYDKFSYLFLEESKNLSLLDKTYVLIEIKSLWDSEDENIIYVINFLLENLWISNEDTIWIDL